MRMKSFLSGFLTALLIGLLSYSIFAAQGNKQFTVSSDDIRIYINGAMLPLKDQNNAKIDLFYHNGFVYAPVRGIAEALDYQVNWDSTKKYVYIVRPVNLSVESFRKITKGMSEKKVIEIAGKPNENVGSGRYTYGYRLADGSLVTIVFDHKVLQEKPARVYEWIVHSMLVKYANGTGEWIIPME